MSPQSCGVYEYMSAIAALRLTSRASRRSRASRLSIIGDCEEMVVKPRPIYFFNKARQFETKVSGSEPSALSQLAFETVIRTHFLGYDFLVSHRYSRCDKLTHRYFRQLTLPFDQERK